jgi:hypothetical protein
VITKEEFQRECKNRGFRLREDFYKKFVDHFQKNLEIDDKFFEALQLLALSKNKSTPTICKVFGVLKDHHDDNEVVRWLCLIGDRMGKRMHKKMVLRKRQVEGLGIE